MQVKTRISVPREPAVDLIRRISEGTYTSFPQCLKEFISNAYDADATRVDIDLDEECNTMTIRDNGVGMTLDDFQGFYASIARTGRGGARSGLGRTRFGRRKIGRFGIGSLAFVGAADRFLIRSVKQGQGEGFEASIDLRELRKHFDKGEDLSKWWRFNSRQWSSESSSTHFTEIEISEIHPDIQTLLQRPGVRKRNEFFKSITQLSGIDELSWQLGIICPVAYERSYPIPEEYLEKGRDILLYEKSRELLGANFSVYLKGTEIRRPIALPSYAPARIKRGGEANLLMRRGIGFDLKLFRAPKGSPLHHEGYLLTQGAEIFPEELQGLLIRVRGVAIGWHRTLNLSSLAVSTLLPSLSGEVWVDGLEEALQFDRESFREDHPLFSWLRGELKKIIEFEEKGWRERSKKRTESKGQSSKDKSKSKTKATSKEGAEAKSTEPSGPTSEEYYISPDIFKEQPDYVTRLVPQVNGSWERDYFELCAMGLRRLMQTLIFALYDKRGWISDIKDPDTREFLSLKDMLEKVSNDKRIGYDKRSCKAFSKVKELGDIAAHDFRVRVRASDLEGIKSDFRFSCERLIFKIMGAGP